MTAKPSDNTAPTVKELVISRAENGGWALSEGTTNVFGGPAKFLGAFTDELDLIAYLSRTLSPPKPDTEAKPCKEPSKQTRTRVLGTDIFYDI